MGAASGGTGRQTEGNTAMENARVLGMVALAALCAGGALAADSFRITPSDIPNDGITLVDYSKRNRSDKRSVG